MLSSGSAIYYDGVAAARRAVTVELEKIMLVIRGPDGDILERWPYEQVEELAAPAGTLRLGRLASPVTSRLDIRDEKLGAVVKELVAAVETRSSADRRARVKVVLWSIAAVGSFLTLAVLGVPAIADRLAPIVPTAVERQLGQAVDAQVRAMLDPKKPGTPLECGDAATEKAGRAALAKLVGRLESASALPMALRVVVVRQREANAFALPGGTIYLFEGLIQKAENADELAGILAHEIGHVAHRDGMRSVLQSAGLSFLFGMVLGDFVGGGAVIIAAQSVLNSAYSREVEAAADLYAVDLMKRTGRDGRAFAAILARIAGAIEPGMLLIADHPETKDRVRSINEHAAAASGAVLVSAPEWAALKQICAGR
jgi:predicted Zn-dependent protease